MRRLILLRHAKSAWPAGIEDRDRPLNKRGREAAPLMAAYLRDEGLLPDLALVSGAQRTRETFAFVEEATPCPVRYVDRLYLAAPRTMLEAVREAPDDVRTLLIVGHNPGLHDLAVSLVGHGDRYAFARLREKMPTAALVVLDFAIEHWREAEPKGARLDRYVTPKMLGGEDED